MIPIRDITSSIIKVYMVIREMIAVVIGGLGVVGNSNAVITIILARQQSSPLEMKK